MPLKNPPGDAHGDIFQTQNMSDNIAMILKENKMSNNSEDIA